MNGLVEQEVAEKTETGPDFEPSVPSVCSCRTFPPVGIVETLAYIAWFYGIRDARSEIRDNPEPRTPSPASRP